MKILFIEAHAIEDIEPHLERYGVTIIDRRYEPESFGFLGTEAGLRMMLEEHYGYRPGDEMPNLVDAAAWIGKLIQRAADLEQGLRDSADRALTCAESWDRAVYNGTHVGDDIREQLQIKGPQ